MTPQIAHDGRQADLTALAEPECQSDPVEASKGFKTALLDGRMVSTWSKDWLVETRDREVEARAILRMYDRDSRIAHLGRYALEMEQFCRVNGLDCDPVEYGAEARRRLEAIIMERWRRSRAPSAQP